ncbi:SRPBCC domain-containing protein [Paenibacillus sp. 481]|uniref:SRPBCC domain-containing protein n=1 Tax=Paenibacillus sp. 481 TaxID=2835869 RepID=UPI001E623FA8|nr:SRPBCC domain-containing protein [Paenibacillus sp. 481]UHA75131.1 SRPBCC domain-containing protein [Paenibacillus sp. 481]
MSNVQSTKSIESVKSTRSVKSVKRDIVIQAPLEKVWQALTVPKHLNRWYTREAEVDFRIGGRMNLAHGWGAYTAGVITEIADCKRFVLQSEDMSLTITTLAQEADGVRVTIEYQMEFPFGEEGQAMEENMAYGTLEFLKNLKSVYENDQDRRANMWKTWLGIQHTTVGESEERVDTDTLVQGTKVLSVREATPAEQAGLQPGDIITKVNDRAISSYAELEMVVNECDIHEQLTCTIWRDGRFIQLQSGLAPYPVAYSA